MQIINVLIEQLDHFINESFDIQPSSETLHNFYHETQSLVKIDVQTFQIHVQ